ncbi:uncharacterized protein [Fopius arisanus]|uniref:Cca_0 protein n=1 Tax=Fopius arisanus TaxID=64838 RepID=A0A0C9PVP5_9HYME|nr:PREDICTED: uncharacterized protein LOC105270115 [Fopius arisanus]
MLAFALRGIVLVAVLSWYSTSIWKMIDGYFKNRFDKYLKEEFEKNPRMRADMAQKVPPVEVHTPQEFLDSCQLDSCPVDKAVALEGDKISSISPSILEENVSNVADDNLRMEESKEESDRSAYRVSSGAKREKSRKIILQSQESPKGKRKKVKTITLTEKDFEEVKKKMAIEDDDFTEFEDEETPEGILVSKLGFKPKADIGNLDRVTEDEFCPISLEYEGDCSETKTWP